MRLGCASCKPGREGVAFLHIGSPLLQIKEGRVRSPFRGPGAFLHLLLLQPRCCPSASEESSNNNSHVVSIAALLAADPLSI